MRSVTNVQHCNASYPGTETLFVFSVPNLWSSKLFKAYDLTGEEYVWLKQMSSGVTRRLAARDLFDEVGNIPIFSPLDR